MIERQLIRNTPENEFPAEGYVNMDLKDVFEQYGPAHGLSELFRRSSDQSADRIDAETAVDILNELGRLVDDNA